MATRVRDDLVRGVAEKVGEIGDVGGDTAMPRVGESGGNTLLRRRSDDRSGNFSAVWTVNTAELPMLGLVLRVFNISFNEVLMLLNSGLCAKSSSQHSPTSCDNPSGQPVGITGRTPDKISSRKAESFRCENGTHPSLTTS